MHRSAQPDGRDSVKTIGLEFPEQQVNDTPDAPKKKTTKPKPTPKPEDDA